MRLTTSLGLATIAVAISMTAVQAKTYTIEEAQSRYIQCYSQEYVPATVAVNTRGRLVRSGSHNYEINGNQWNYVYNPPVYIQTRRVIEPDHYTLVTSACPAQ